MLDDGGNIFAVDDGATKYMNSEEAAA